MTTKSVKPTNVAVDLDRLLLTDLDAEAALLGISRAHFNAKHDSTSSPGGAASNVDDPTRCGGARDAQ